MKDRQYIIVKAIVLGSWRVQSSMLSRSAKSLEENVDRDKGKGEEEGWWTKVDVCVKDEVEVVENKREEMREEGSREGRGWLREAVGELKVEGSIIELWKL